MKTNYKIAVSVLAMVTAVVILCGCQSTKQAKADTPTGSAVYQSPEQTSCPVTGGPVNKHIYTVYQGKKVYFCCEGCKEEFEKNPEKYLGKLPQFSK